MKNSFFKIVFLQVLLLLCTGIKAQYQPTFTQYMSNEMFINPAYTGSQEALSVNGLYRNQWMGMEGAPVTRTFTAHAPFFNKKTGMGIALLNETIGVTTRNEAYLNYAYRIVMPKSVLSFGLLGGLESVQELFSQVKTIQAKDPQFMSNASRYILPNFGFGLYYYTSRFFTGISVPRLVKGYIPVAGAEVTNTINPRAFVYYAVLGYVFDLADHVKVKPSAMTKLQAGVPVQTDLSLVATLKNVVGIGAAYRSSDAVSGILNLHVTPQFRVGYSYDYTLSRLQQFNSGSHEIQLSYLFVFNKAKIITPRLF